MSSDVTNRDWAIPLQTVDIEKRRKPLLGAPLQAVVEHVYKAAFKNRCKLLSGDIEHCYKASFECNHEPSIDWCRANFLLSKTCTCYWNKGTIQDCRASISTLPGCIKKMACPFSTLSWDAWQYFLISLARMTMPSLANCKAASPLLSVDMSYVRVVSARSKASRWCRVVPVREMMVNIVWLLWGSPWYGLKLTRLTLTGKSVQQSDDYRQPDKLFILWKSWWYRNRFWEAQSIQTA